jgi:hypothetical protein
VCGAIPAVTLERALHADHPVVRAAAALSAWPGHRGRWIIDDLLRGALGFDRDVADACREALRHSAPQALDAANAALRRNAEPDLYGVLHPLTTEQRDWLARFTHSRDAA